MTDFERFKTAYEVAEHLEEVNAISQLPSRKQINAVYHRI